ENKTNTGPDDLLALAQMCQKHKKRLATAADLYRNIFVTDPGLADDLARQHRYKAACAATLAGLGQTEEALKLKEENKSELRRQARHWLHADLDLYAKQMKADPDGPQAVIQTAHRLSHWQIDPDLAGVRDLKELAKLTNEERQAWQKLWSEVQQLHS